MNNNQNLTDTLESEYTWLSALIDLRSKELDHKIVASDIFSLDFIPKKPTGDEVYSLHATKHNWSIQDRVLVLLSCASQFEPALLRNLIHYTQSKQELEFTEQFKTTTDAGQATFQLALWLLEGANIKAWYKHYDLLNLDYPLFKHTVLDNSVFNEESNRQVNVLDYPLKITHQFFIYLITGLPYEPKYSTSFPASKLETSYSREDLLLNDKTTLELNESIAWMKKVDQLKNVADTQGEIKGYKSLFYGPPGTGKTMAVRVIGKELGKTVYKIDISKVVSKYVGETEKNLKAVFDLAENRDWVLFFDEGDALFGKRSSTKSSQDRYANQEVAYLLQRMEDYPGILLLATNNSSNLDDAFKRRFHSFIYFGKPDHNTRLALWQKAYSGTYQLQYPEILTHYAQKYELSGAEIINIKHFSIVRAMTKNRTHVLEEELRRGLELELAKYNKVLSPQSK